MGGAPAVGGGDGGLAHEAQVQGAAGGQAGLGGGEGGGHLVGGAVAGHEASPFGGQVQVLWGGLHGPVPHAARQGLFAAALVHEGQLAQQGRRRMDAAAGGATGAGQVLVQAGEVADGPLGIAGPVRQHGAQDTALEVVWLAVQDFVQGGGGGVVLAQGQFRFGQLQPGADLGCLVAPSPFQGEVGGTAGGHGAVRLGQQVGDVLEGRAFAGHQARQGVRGPGLVVGRRQAGAAHAQARIVGAGTRQGVVEEHACAGIVAGPFREDGGQFPHGGQVGVPVDQLVDNLLGFRVTVGGHQHLGVQGAEFR